MRPGSRGVRRHRTRRGFEVRRRLRAHLGNRHRAHRNPEQAQAVCASIRATLAELFGSEVADGMRVLYGGSMNVGNVEALIAQPDIDGGLVGGASLKADQFIQLVKACL